VRVGWPSGSVEAQPIGRDRQKELIRGETQIGGDLLWIAVQWGVVKAFAGHHHQFVNRIPSFG